MRIEIETRIYEFSHGKKPRGYGHWIFSFFTAGQQGMTGQFGFTESYGDAGKLARAKAAELGATRIVVMD